MASGDLEARDRLTLVAISVLRPRRIDLPASSRCWWNLRTARGQEKEQYYRSSTTQCIEMAPQFFHYNKGFIYYVFCRNWAVRNPAVTRLDSSLVTKQVA